MLSKRAKYALKALIALASEPPGEPVRIADLAEREDIPQKFLELILLDLRNRGVLQSKKGKGGGYFLGQAPQSIYVGQLIRQFDGPLAAVPCASQTAYARCRDCQDEAGCGVRWVMKEVRDATALILDKTTLADLVQHEKESSHP
ncbi:MAG: Rrf2 family transcriptional regulator [Gemmatimonadota bacterium]